VKTLLAHSWARTASALVLAGPLLLPTGGLAQGAANASSSCGNPCEGTVSVSLALVGHTQAGDLEPAIKHALDEIGATYTAADVKAIATRAAPKVSDGNAFSVQACADSGSPCVNFILPRYQF
jgi:hypothetical protein